MRTQDKFERLTHKIAARNRASAKRKIDRDEMRILRKQYGVKNG